MRALGGNPPTFRARLMASTALLAIGVLTATGLVVYLGASRALQANLDDALLSIARTQIAAAFHEPAGGIDLPKGPPAHLALPGGSGYEEFVQIEDRAGKIVARTANLEHGQNLESDPRHAAMARAGSLSFVDTRLAGAPCRAIYYPLRDRQGRPLVAIIAISQEPMHRSLRSLLGVILAALVATGALAAWASGRLASRLTRPLSRIAAASRAVGEHNLAARIPDVSPDEELRHVTAVLNEMLTRLDAAFRDQRRFVADASHELRTRLSNLRGTVEVALRRPRTADECRDTLQVTLSEVDRLSRLVADLLTLSRADAGQLVVGGGEVRLDGVAREAAAACAQRARDAGIELIVDAAEEVSVTGDADRLRQVVDNLLDNALRYSPAGSAVRIGVGMADGNARITVRDSGPGIALELRSAIFERFYRADPARARRSGGAGLGLAIARAIAVAHGGELTVASEPGEGAEFVLQLPARPAEQPDTPRGAP